MQIGNLSSDQTMHLSTLTHEEVRDAASFKRACETGHAALRKHTWKHQ